VRPPLPSPLKIRADAARNRARILEAAAEVFAERGLEASTAEVARRAGVGEATLYRRFPSRDDLVLAIVQTQMDEVAAAAEECLRDPDPWRGLERFMHEMIARRVSDVGALDAVKAHCMASPELGAHRRRVLDATSALVRRGQEAGVVREDLTGTDLSFLLTAAASVGGLPFPGLREDVWKRYLGVILDGMRPEGATKLRPAAPSRRVFG